MAIPKIGIEVKNLVKKLKTHTALDGVSLFLKPALLHGLIGPSGAGKTTLLRVLMGLLQPTSGRVDYQDQGKPVAFKKVRPLMAYMPQQQSLYADLSVSEHLDFFRDLYQIPRKEYEDRRKDLLHITRLEEFQSRPAGQLSGGMYKKL